MSAIQSTGQSAGTTSTNSVTSAKDQEINYLNLLITQLKNQDPENPSDTNQMAQQMAMFSQLQQLEELNTTAAQSLAQQQIAQASALLGKTVVYITQDGSGAAFGPVQAVSVDGSEISLSVNNQKVALSDVIQIQNQ